MSMPDRSEHVTVDEAQQAAVVAGAAWSRATGPRNLRSLEDALAALADPDTVVWVDLEEQAPRS